MVPQSLAIPSRCPPAPSLGLLTTNILTHDEFASSRRILWLQSYAMGSFVIELLPIIVFWSVILLLSCIRPLFLPLSGSHPTAWIFSAFAFN